MQKLIATLISHPSPLEREFFWGEKIIEFSVNDAPDTEEILCALEPLVMKIRGDDETALSLIVQTESGRTLLRGTIKEGFNGICFL